MPADAQDDDLVMTLVEAALALPAEERGSYLDAICTQYRSVCDDVRRRVEWEERMQGFLLESLIRRPDGVDARFRPDQTVGGRFRIIRALGDGGMGFVYEAHDEKLDRRVALKCARNGFQNRMSPEARAALEVSHPNVCKLHELHTAETPAGPVDFLTMEFVDGATLAEHMGREGPLAPVEALGIAVQICDGLSQAHRLGVIHGDIKPANIILSRSPEGAPRAVITDFGLAQLKRPHDTKDAASAVGGTLDYMAPELLHGSGVSVASDIYALGVLFHAMLAGRAPTSNDERGQLTITNLSRPWNRVIRRCIEAEPDRRFASVAGVRDALVHRRPILRWAIAAVLVLATFLTAWLRNPRENPSPPVRLALLPVAVEGEPIPSAAGVAADVSGRLSGLRRNFTVIPASDALRSHVDTPEKAWAVLGATHALTTRVHRSGDQIFARTTIADAASGSVLRSVQGSYSSRDTDLLAQAIIGTVSGAFGLRATPSQPVSKLAYSSYSRGMALLRRDNPSADEAIACFEEATTLDPRSALPYAGLAEAQMQKFEKGDGRQWLDLAGVNIDKAKSINPDTVPVLLISGRFQQAHGWYERAIAEFSRAAQLEPSNADAWRSLAQAYESTNRPEEAIATYRKALQAQPDYYRHYADFGNFYFYRSQFDEAEQMYRRVAKLTPRSEIGHMDLGLALMQQGKLREAETELLLAVRLRPTPMLLMNTGALYYLQERFEEAVHYFERSVAMGASDSIQYRDLGDAYRQLRRHKKAAAAYHTGRDLAEDEVARNPRQAFSRVQLGLICAELGDARRAEFEVSQALALDPGNTAVVREAAIAYEALGRHDQALQLLRKAPARTLSELSRHPDMKELWQAIEGIILNNPG